MSTLLQESCRGAAVVSLRLASAASKRVSTQTSSPCFLTTTTESLALTNQRQTTGQGHTSSPLIFGSYNVHCNKLPVTINQTRTFAKRAAANRNAVAAPLANEQLIASIMRRSPDGANAQSVNVRLVVDQPKEDGSGGGGGGKQVASADVVSLATAIQTAVDLDLDLVEIALQQDIPVIKATSISSLMYQNKRKKQAAKNKGPATSRKEFTFRVKIEEADLMRTVNRMTSFLEKGHQCAIRVRCPHWLAEKEPDTLSNFMDRVAGLLNNSAEPLTQRELNEAKTQGAQVFQRRKVAAK